MEAFNVMKAINAAQALVDSMHQRLHKKSTLCRHEGLSDPSPPFFFFLTRKEGSARLEKDCFEQDNNQTNQNANCKNQENREQSMISDRVMGLNQCQSSFQIHGPHMEWNILNRQCQKSRDSNTTPVKQKSTCTLSLYKTAHLSILPFLSNFANAFTIPARTDLSVHCY